MIDISQIFSVNMEMLKKQESELTNALNIIQQIKKMLDSGSVSSSPSRRGRKKKSSSGSAMVMAPEIKVERKRGRKSKALKTAETAPSSAKKDKLAGRAQIMAHIPKGVKPPRKGTWMEKILMHIEANGPTPSGKIIESIFNSQKKVKTIQDFRKLLFPVFTRAYKQKILVNKNGLVHFVQP
jgi:hypothetical protein